MQVKYILHDACTPNSHPVKFVQMLSILEDQNPAVNVKPPDFVTSNV